MSELGSRGREALDSAVAPFDDPPDWDDVLRRSGMRASRRRWPRVTLAVALAAAALFAVALVAPWQSSGHGLLEKALAAVGDEPVLHAVITWTTPAGVVVDLATGREQERESNLVQEIWYDPARALEHTVSRSNGVLTNETLHTADGVFDENGQVYTCAWIAAHPLEATKARVSCNASGDNGTTPRTIPEEPPVLDPPLAAFLDGYRDALASGRARKVDDGELDSRPIVWLELPDIHGSPERVALDRDTLRPVLVRSGRWEYRVRTIESVGRDEANFSRPALAPPEEQPSIGAVVDRHEVEPTAAAREAGFTPLWLGMDVSGLELARAYVTEITTGFSRDSGIEQRRSTGFSLSYGEPSRGDFVTIEEAPRPEFAYGWTAKLGGIAGPAAPDGQLATQKATSELNSPPPHEAVEPTGGTLAVGQARIRGIYVTIRASSRELMIQAARALRPLPAG